MKSSLSVVVNTKNVAGTLERCLRSVTEVSDEIVVMDMNSQDATLDIAKMFSARIFFHEDTGYVEPARNAAIARAKSDWVLVLDADEELSPGLKDKLPILLSAEETSAYFLPRQNIIFGKVAHTGWWPDYQLRLFRNGSVDWPAQIHSVPKVAGKAVYLPADEKESIIHYNYADVDEFIDRAQRYAAISASGKSKKDESTPDPLDAFFEELITRYYAWDGHHDGFHGEFLSVLQGCASVFEAAKIWEHRGFTDKKKPPKLSHLLDKYAQDARWWEAKLASERSHGAKRWIWRLRMALRK